ncbi:MAG: ParB/RepB/Spo0J family partition protein [Bacilli bacterium]|nr:ParB/RepB/Spo0J family partition protein [Bacilli bacterium]
METKRRALGKGLEQLFNNENFDLDAFEKKVIDTTPKEEIVELALDELRPNPYQPRKLFNDAALEELSDSIKEHGVFQPIIAKKSIKGYEIIAGERRFRASKLAGKETIPAIIRDFTDEEMMEISLLENLQRENLNPLEEALAYKTMIDKLGITQDDLSKRVGKSRSHVTNIIGILRLPSEVQKMIASDKLSMSHAKLLSKIENDDEIIKMANKIVDEKLPVHDVEDMTTNVEKKHKVERKVSKENKEFKYVEDMLRDKLDTKVKISDKKIIINFTNVADLNRILEILDVKE